MKATYSDHVLPSHPIVRLWFYTLACFSLRLMHIYYRTLIWLRPVVGPTIENYIQFLVHNGAILKTIIAH
jgi:hypothetical protein